MQQFKFILMLVMLGLLTGCTSLPRFYSGEEVHGWVIDSETKEPIKDVVVVIFWRLEGGFPHTDDTANVHIEETLTDESGYYSFPEWGPEFTVDGRLSESAPRLKYYKFGYDTKSYANTISGNPNPDNSVSEHSGKKIELIKFTGSLEEYPKVLGSFYTFLSLGHYRETLRCQWVKVPIFTSEVIKAEQYFKQKNIYSSLPHLGSLSAPECNNPEEILKEYLK